MLLAGDKTGTVSVSNAETGLTLRLVSEHKNGAAVTALAVSSLCSHWLIATADRRLSVWQAAWVSDRVKTDYSNYYIYT